MASDRLYELDGKKGHWYTDEQGNRYFVAQGQTPKEGWEATKRRKMIKGGKYVKDDGDDKGEQEISADEYRTYEADEEERFDETTDDDFEDDESDNFDKYSEPAYGEEEGHDYELDALRERQKRGLDNDIEDPKDENISDDPMNPENPKYKGYRPSDMTNVKQVGESVTVDNFDTGKKETWSIVEYIPYGALQRGDNRKLYGLVTDYDGSDTFNGGAIVAASLENAKQQLEGQLDLAEQGSERYTKRGKWDEDYFNMMRDEQYGWSDEDKADASKRYGWDLSKDWSEQEHVKNAPASKWRNADKKGPQTANIDANVDEIAKEVASKFGEANVKVGENGHILLKDPEGFDPVAIANEDEIPAGAIVKIMPNWREPNENPDDTYFVKEDRGDRLLLWSPSKSSSFGGYTYEWPKNTMYVPLRMRQGKPSEGKQGSMGKQGSDGDSWSAENPKYKDFNTSDATNVKVLEEGEEYEDPNTGKKSKLKIIEYTPYGLLKFGRKDRMYGIVGDDYEGGDTHRKGAIVAPSLKSAKEQLKEFTDYYKSQKKEKRR